MLVSGNKTNQIDLIQTTISYPPPPIARIGKFPVFSSAIFPGGWSKLGKQVQTLYRRCVAVQSIIQYEISQEKSIIQ